jgi:hypothetical protein
MDIRPDEKGAQYFIRQKTKEAQGSGDDSYRKGKQERDMIVDRMKKRREMRMAGEPPTTTTAIVILVVILVIDDSMDKTILYY